MSQRTRMLSCVTTLVVAFSTVIEAAPRHIRTLANAAGAGINVPLVGRLTGGGNTLYVTALDVTNGTAGNTQVDFYLDGTSGAVTVALNGSIDSSGALVAQGAGTMRARQNVHYDDFVDSLVQANLLPAAVETNGFIGSVLFIFNGFSKSGQGTVTARFYNAFGGGTVGVSLKGREITVNEPRSLLAAVRDSRGKPGPQLYSNVFINNVGITAAGTSGDPVTVQITAYANSSGQAVGNPITIQNLNPGQTTTVGNILQALGVPPTEDTVLIYATVISGSSLIEGLVSQIDTVTKDGSAFEMSRADF